MNLGHHAKYESASDMAGMLAYDSAEIMRRSAQRIGTAARIMDMYPGFSLVAAWGRAVERSFYRMSVKPEWGIPPVEDSDGILHPVLVETEVKKPFGDLIHFRVPGRNPPRHRVLLVAPMSGHYATLLRSTVISLLPDCEVFVTDWRNARDIPEDLGRFDIEDYTLYLVEFMKHLGPELNVIAVCQPAPLALAASAIMAGECPELQPKTLILIGGPIDPGAAPTKVTEFADRTSMDELEARMTGRVGFSFPGAGRRVYPGMLQLSSFITMNAEKHAKSFSEKIIEDAFGRSVAGGRHDEFYDEYLAVTDMTAEFYLSTVSRIFKSKEIAGNRFSVNGRHVDLGIIRDMAIMTVEGEKDDISAPGQCLAALDLCCGVPAERKLSYLEPGAGHYGIFAGKSWRNNIRPLVLDFMERACPS